MNTTAGPDTVAASITASASRPQGHSPDHVVIVSSVPRSATGKRLEIPLKRIIEGEEVADIIDLSVVIDPGGVAEAANRIRTVLHAVPG